MGVTIIGTLTRKRGTSNKKSYHWDERKPFGYFLKQGKKRKPLNFPVDTTCNARKIKTKNAKNKNKTKLALHY